MQPAPDRGSGRFSDLYAVFRSPRTTAAIIAVLLALYFIGLIVPQKALFKGGADYEAWRTQHPVLSRSVELLQLNEIYVSPVTIFFLGLFFANLVTVLIHRVPLIFRRAYLVRGDREGPDAELLKKRPRAWTISVAQGGADILPEVRRFFKKRFWTFIDTKAERTLIAVRNRYSPFGFLLFHVSFLLCLVGGLFVMYTRFSGELVLTQGQDFNADIRQFSRITKDAKIFKALPPVGLRVESVKPLYEKDAGADKDVSTDLDIRLKVKYWDDIRDEMVKINQPVTRGPVSVLAIDIGVSPLFVVKTAGGATLDGGYVSLNILKGQEDSFQFEGMPYTFGVRFYPDHFVKDGQDASRSENLNNPVVRIRIKSGEKTVRDGLLRPGHPMTFDSLTLSFEDVRYWVKFRLIREYGNVPLFIGYLFGALGLIMRLVFYQKTLHIAVEQQGAGARIWIDGWSEYYQHSFGEDMTNMMEFLRAALEGTFGSAVMERGGRS